MLFAVTRRAQLAAFAGALAAVVGLAMVLLTLQSGPWPMFYLWDLPRRHELKRELMTRFWSDVLTRFTLPLVVGPFFLLGRALAGDRKRLVFYATMTLGLLGMAWGSSSNVGGGRNVHLPAYAAFAILFGLAINEALARLEPVAGRTGPIRAYLLCVALAQFAVLIYNPRLVVPYSSDRWDGERLTATLAALPGPVFAGSYQGFTSDANTVSPDLGAVIELEGAFGGTGTQEGSTWEGLFAGAVAERRLTYVIVDPDKSGFIVPQLANAYGYKDAGPLFPEGDVYWAWRTGWSPKAELYMPPPTLH